MQINKLIHKIKSPSSAREKNEIKWKSNQK